MSYYRGRQVDDIALWQNYIDIPPGAEKETYYWDKVVCPNPEHDTLKRHFQVNVKDGLVHCFAMCGISGTYAHAIRVIEECNERQARKIILGHARPGKFKRTVRKQPRPTGNSVSAESLEYDRLIPQAGLDYLERRGISAVSVARFEIGWCRDTLRLVIPGRDVRGRTRFLIKRAVRDDQRPKYLYTEGFPKNRLLFGAFDSERNSDYAVIVEGALDVIKLFQYGIPAVATLGTGISEEQVRILARLRPRKLYLMLDKDQSGVHGIEIAERRLRGKYPLFVCRYPRERSDPAELTRQEAELSLARAVPHRKFKRLTQQVRR